MRFRTSPRLLHLLVACCAAALSPRPAHARADLPDNPLIRQGVLANGLRYTVVHHPAATGAPRRIALCLRIDAGTINEEDHQRGSARAVELLARDAVTSAPSAQTLRTAGVRPDQDLQSSANFEWLSFTLGVPASEPAAPTVRAALESLSRVLTAPAAPTEPQRWDAVRAIMTERDRAAMGTAVRANNSLLPRLIPDSRYATRPLMGDNAVAPDLSPAVVSAFAARWIIPANAALVIAGDGVPTAELEAAARAAFSRLPTGPRPPRTPVGDVESSAPVALVLADSGLATDFVQLSRTSSPPAHGIDSTERFIEDLTARVLIEALARRLESAQSDDSCPIPGFRRAINPRFSRDLAMGAMVAGGPPGSALDLARCLVAQTRAVQTGGFTPEEFEAAKAAVLTAFDADARAEPSLSPEKTAERYADALTLRDTPLSASQRAEVARNLMPRVTAAAVIAEANTQFDLNRTALVALIPPEREYAKPLTEAALRAAFDTPAPAPRAATAGADAFSASHGAQPPADLTLPPPTPAGAVKSLELHPPSGVLTATFASGVRFHHRAMPSPTPAGRVVLSLSFASSLMHETPDTRALTYALIAALKEPATDAFDSVSLRRILALHAVTWEVGLAPHAVTLTIAAPAESAETAFALASALARSGVLERPALDRVRARLVTTSLQGAHNPEYSIADLYPRAVFPADPRPRPPTAEAANAIVLSAAQAHVRRALLASPLTAAVTGDIDRDRALNLAARAFGTLEPRNPPAPASPTVAALDAPVSQHIAIDTADGRSVVLEGFRAEDESDTRTVLALEVAADALAASLTTLLRDTLHLSAAARVDHRPSRGWAGAGEFWAAASCAVGREDDLAEAIRSSLDSLAGTPLSPEELRAARERIAARRAEELTDANWWSIRLSRDPARAPALDAALSAPGDALALTAQDIRSAVQSIAHEHRRVSLRVTPR